MTEQKTVVIVSHKAKGAIEERGSFGWELLTNRNITLKEAKKIDPKLCYDKSDNFFSELTFQRDTNIPNYEEIKRLEAEYDALADTALGSSDGSDLFLGFCLGYWFLIIPLLLLPFAYIRRAIANKKIAQRAQQNTSSAQMRRAYAIKAKKLLEGSGPSESIGDF